jgi:hypothetical protein
VVALGSLNGANGFRLDGFNGGDSAGGGLSALGDVNGDGYPDFAVGVGFYNGAGINRGAAFVAFGQSSGFTWASSISLDTIDYNLGDPPDAINGFRLNGVANYDYAGLSVSGAGDLNGDGQPDFLVSARGADAGGTDRGSVYVVFGRSSGVPWPAVMALSGLNGTTGFRLDGVADGDYAGLSASALGDVNGDGNPDIIVGAPHADGGGADRGAAYVVFGRSSGVSWPATLALSSLDGNNGFRLDGAADGDNAGWSVSGAGDVNGDGNPDILVGVPTADGGGANRGAAYVVFGRSSGVSWLATLALSSLDGNNGFRLDGVADDDYAGWSVSGAGDVNGDGNPDILVGASNADGDGTDRGVAYVVFGRSSGVSWDATLALSSLDGNTGFRLDGVADGDFAGESVAPAGDVNGDGAADLLVGAWGADAGGIDRGSAWVVFGRSSGSSWPATLSLDSLNSTTGFRMDGEEYTYAGDTVAPAGDVNGDGIADILVGAPDAGMGGAAYVIFGGP